MYNHNLNANLNFRIYLNINLTCNCHPKTCATYPWQDSGSRALEKGLQSLHALWPNMSQKKKKKAPGGWTWFLVGAAKQLAHLEGSV